MTKVPNGLRQSPLSLKDLSTCRDSRAGTSVNSMANEKAPAPDAVRMTPRGDTIGGDGLISAHLGWQTERACCCPSHPVVRVIIPPAGDRPRSMDLLLCGHHYRASRESLEAAHRAVYDQTNALISASETADA